MTGSTLMPGHAPLKDHPLADLFPLLSDKELAELAEDIAENGQAETIKLHRGLILDGRNRYRACNLKNLPVRYEVFAGSDRDALNWVISKNLRRRHLNESQRAMVAARLANLKLGDNQHSAAPIGAPSLPIEGVAPLDQPAALVSQSEAADLLAVGRRSVQRAAEVQEKAAPELQAAVESGKVAVSTAVDLTELPASEQTKIAGLSQNDILEAAKKIRRERGEKRRAERVEKLKAQAANNTPLSTARQFPIIYFDPATKFAAGDSDRSTENHYNTMKEEEIALLPIAHLATPDAVLLMWSTAAWLRKSIRLIEHWGFEYKTNAVWDKELIGLGYWFQSRHEHLIVATRGKMIAPENGAILGPSLYSERRGPHSAKPLYFREIIDRVPEWRELPKVELFARVDGPLPENWFAWGNQANVPVQQKLAMEATA